MEIETIDMSQAAAQEQAAAQAQTDREREQPVDNSSSAQTITDPNLGQTVNILD